MTRRIGVLVLLAVLRFAVPAARAQERAPAGQASREAGPVVAGAFRPDRAAAVSDSVAPAERLRLAAVLQEGSRRGRNAIIGGVIGAATGLVVCTVISNIAKDEGTGFSTCTTDGYLGFGLGGLVLGALVGAFVE